MNRLWLVGAIVVLAAAGVVGWLNANADTRLEAALILADVTTPGCMAPGQVHLVLGNASDQALARVEGVVSVAASLSEIPRPVGNFVLTGPVPSRQQLERCVTVEEGAPAGQARETLVWLARPTMVDFVEGSPGGSVAASP